MEGLIKNLMSPSDQYEPPRPINFGAKLSQGGSGAEVLRGPLGPPLESSKKMKSEQI